MTLWLLWLSWIEVTASLRSDPVEDFRNDHSPIDQHPRQQPRNDQRRGYLHAPWPKVADNQGNDLSYRTFINGVLSGNILIDTTHVATDTIDYIRAIAALASVAWSISSCVPVRQSRRGRPERW